MLSNIDQMLAKNENIEKSVFQKKACLKKNACGKPETWQTWVDGTNMYQILTNIDFDWIIKCRY